MSIELFDITGDLITYLLSKTSITDLVNQRIYAGRFPVSKTAGFDSKLNPKIMLRHAGGNHEDNTYRYIFICRASTQAESKNLALEVAKQFVEENFELVKDSKDVVHYAKLDGSLIDSIDEDTGNPETYFYINFYSIF